MSTRRYDVLDRPEVLSVLFHPRPDASLPRLVAGVHTVRFPVAHGLAIGGKIFAARQSAPVIVYFHGNGEIASDYDGLASFYTGRGITLFVIDFRGYGASDGMPTATAMLEDARVCFGQVGDILHGRGLEASRLFLMDRSLGSAAVLEIASETTGEIEGLIIESGFAYTFPLIERIGFVRPADADEERDGFGNLAKIARITLPTLIIHGERDWIIPIEDGIALYEASAAVDKRLLRIADAGHNDLMMVGEREYFQAIADLCSTGRTSG